MPHTLRFCLALHNHQPVGNFDHVFEQAYQDSYLPFLDVFEPFTGLALSLHTSGPLMEWLDQHHPDYVDRLARLVRAGRMEIIGGAYYESILTMIPPRDRVGQISTYTQWLQQRLGGTIRGMWMPERVWEQSLTSDIIRAGIEYTLLDDFHFRNAGMTPEQLHGYLVTEDNGYVLRVFPGSERLRYLIPFAAPHETIDYLQQIAETTPHAVLVFGDDGEKFGTWPDTKAHVYDNGWLRQFLQLLQDNQQWLKTITLSEAIDATPPCGKVYLPDGSYREMTEWSLPTGRQVAYDHLVHEMEHDPRWPEIKQFVRGGYWRNFKVKYPETNEMYARMMLVSRRLQTLEEQGKKGEWIDAARRELYRGQCNCAYWHGAFGGVYLPHLRNAIFNHLIAAENLLDRAIDKQPGVIERQAADLNLDGRPEVMVANDKLFCFVSPSCGGQMYELDVRSICHNLLATLTRRDEAYHHKVRQGQSAVNGEVASIHDRVVFKQANLDQRLQIDRVPRKSLIDHFYDHNVSLDAIARSEATEQGDFVGGEYEAKLRSHPDRVQIQLVREGQAAGKAIRITKAVTITTDQSLLDLVYQLEGLTPGETLHFSVEFNFAGMPAGADDRYFYQAGRKKLGQLGQQVALSDIREFGLIDEWLGLDVNLTADRPTSFWAYPVETVSQSEGGFELVHQSVAVQPHWFVQGDAEGRWAVKMRLAIDTRLAESRMEQAEAVSVS